MRKISKIASIFLALIMAVATPVLFAGCKSDITIEEASKVMVDVSNNYRKTHNYYVYGNNEFADTTLTLTTKVETQGTLELEYKANANDEETVKGKFTNTSSNVQTLTVGVNTFTWGEGDEAVKYTLLKVDVVKVEKEKSYDVDDEDETLKENVIDTKTSTTYTLAVKEVAATDNEDAYLEFYIVKYQKVEDLADKDSQPVETKQYYLYDYQDNYTDLTRNYLESFNNLVYNAYFTDMEDIAALLQFTSFTKDGNKVEMNIDVTVPSIYEYASLLTRMTRYISFEGKNLGTAKVGMEMTAEDGVMAMSMEINVATSANRIELPALTGYEAVEDAIQVPELPEYFEASPRN